MNLHFFAEMAWKSALISAAALALTAALRSRSAADRALVLRLGVAMLLLLPGIALMLPSLEIVAFAAPEPLPAVPLAAGDISALSLPPAEPTIWDDPTPLIVLAYLGGLMMVGGRLVAGLWTLHRWTRAAREVECPEWLAAFERVRWAAPDGETVRLLVSHAVPSPLSWGWRRPAILIDPDTLGQPDQAEPILAHEVAHVARRDWPVLMMTRLAAALFWFNPLVWLLEREIVQQAEEAADCAAAECVEPTLYAQTLLSWAQANGSALPAHSIAPAAGALGRRIRTILDRRLRERPSGSAWTALALLLCLAIAAPVAATRLVAAQAEAPQPPPAPPAPAVPPVPAAPHALEAPAAPGDLGDVVISTEALAEIERTTSEAVAAATAHIPAMVAGAVAAVDPAAIRQAVHEAQAELRRNPIHRRHIEAAMREAARARARAQAASQRDIRLAMREAQRARQRAHASMASGAEGMMRGAEGMEQGARQMEREAELLQDRDYRERQIARARARGEEVTHEELLEAAEGLREGAEGLRDGARDMREAAREMRAGND